LLKYYNIKSVREIIDGEKIKWTYLKANPLNLEQIALKGYDDPEEILNLVTTYVDYDKVFTSSLYNKLSDFYNAMKWGKIPENNNVGKFFSFS
jgi:hypothetical protein